MSKRKPVTKSSNKKMCSSRLLLISWRARMKNTSSKSSRRMMILINSLKQWESNSLTCVRTITTKLITLKLLSSEKEVKSSKEIPKKLLNCLHSTQNWRVTINKRRVEKKKNTYKNLKIWGHLMQMIKRVKKLNLKKKCKFFRNVWKTWKLYTNWMRQNLNLILKFSNNVKESMKIPRMDWRRERESLLKS